VRRGVGYRRQKHSHLRLKISPECYFLTESDDEELEEDECKPRCGETSELLGHDIEQLTDQCHSPPNASGRRYPHAQHLQSQPDGAESTGGRGQMSTRQPQFGDTDVIEAEEQPHGARDDGELPISDSSSTKPGVSETATVTGSHTALTTANATPKPTRVRILPLNVIWLSDTCRSYQPPIINVEV
jgi:hypothetical protein